MSHILVLNCGSSSVKFALIDPNTTESLFAGLAENIGQENCSITFKSDDKKQLHLKNGQYKEIFLELKKYLDKKGFFNKVLAIGHRVVAGGQYFSKSALITPENLEKIKICIALAPLHNPAHVEGINFCEKIFVGLPQVAVFDTAFHQTIPSCIAEYAIPIELTQDLQIRKYGAHGTSHKYVSMKAAEIIGKDKANMIVAHLGNGCSITAVVGGKSMDTSMGLTPLDGLIMGTRSGSIDPSVFGYLADNLGWDAKKTTMVLNKQSGLLGICGHNDMRKVSELAENGDELAVKAIEMFCQRAAEFVSKYMLHFDELDALVFTGGIGENAVDIRENIVAKLKNIGFAIDTSKNSAGETFIESSSSHKIMIVPTNEELMIAQDTLNLI
ncbi:MAG: acetate kinase [Francisella sp.]|jgi:acetate kinase